MVVLRFLIPFPDNFYTRAGAFEATSDGKLVTRDSYRYELRGIDDQNVQIGLEEGESLLARRIEDDGKIVLVVSKNGEDSLRDSGNLRSSISCLPNT